MAFGEVALPEAAHAALVEGDEVIARRDDRTAHDLALAIDAHVHRESARHARFELSALIAAQHSTGPVVAALNLDAQARVEGRARIGVCHRRASSFTWRAGERRSTRPPRAISTR